MAVHTVLMSVRDNKNQVSTMEFNIPGATTLADAQIMAQEMALLADPMLLGAISRLGISVSVDLPGGLTGSPSTGADVEEGARFQHLTSGNFRSGLRMPTFNESRIVSGSRAVDLTDADVIAWVDAMNDGLDITGAGGSGVISPCDKRGEDLESLVFAQEQFQASRG